MIGIILLIGSFAHFNRIIECSTYRSDAVYMMFSYLSLNNFYFNFDTNTLQKHNESLHINKHDVIVVGLST